MRQNSKSSVRFLITTVTWLVLAGCGAGSPSGERPDLAARIDALFAPLTTGDSPGAAVMVVRNDEVLYAAGYGYANLERREPITPQTSFRLASVSKQLTAMAVMMLAEHGELDYDDPVVKFLPELERFGKTITLRHLLTHTSGLPDYYDVLEEETLEGMPDTEQAMLFLAAWDEPPLFAPGERYEYSNPGYEMLALVVERVSGKTFGQFLADTIFTPLGMTHTVVRDSSEPVIPDRALGYARKDGSFELMDDHRLNHIIGSGGIYSSVEDLARWSRALDGETLVSRATLEAAWTPVELAGGEPYPYGFGWRLGNYGGLGQRLCHSGHWLGFSNYLARYPAQRTTVIVLSNIEDFESEEYAGRIIDLLFPSTLIAGATVVDGTGAPRFTADLRIEGDRIAAVGDLEPEAGEPVVDAAGLVLAPGFIDTHSHADSAILTHRAAVAAVSQGITTTVGGQDGESELPLGRFFARLEERPAAINLASYVGHGTVRGKVMGEDFRRTASPEEIASMAALVEQEMQAGALGLSSGLEYDPGIYSTTAEVVALARVAAASGGRYISHIRSEDRRFWEAVEEILTIGREAGLPVQISHVKLALRSLHGQAGKLITILDEARAAGIDVTADIYPYTYWQSTLTVMFPDRNFSDREAAEYAVEELAAPEDMLIPGLRPRTGVGRQDPGRDRGPARHRPGGDPDGPDPPGRGLARRSRSRRRHRHRRRERHRHQHGRGRHRPPRGLAVVQYLHRRRARRNPPARVRFLPSRPRPLRPRTPCAHAGGRGPQDDRPGRRQPGDCRPRSDRPRARRRSRPLRPRRRARPGDGAGTAGHLGGHRVGVGQRPPGVAGRTDERPPTGCGSAPPNARNLH